LAAFFLIGLPRRTREVQRTRLQVSQETL